MKHRTKRRLYSVLLIILALGLRSSPNGAGQPDKSFSLSKQKLLGKVLKGIPCSALLPSKRTPAKPLHGKANHAKT